MAKKSRISASPNDPPRDAMVDVYMYLLRKAAERKREITATADAKEITGNVPIQPIDTASEEQALNT